MTGNTACTIFIGNLDEKVNDRVLYEILIQAGRIVDMHIPRDKETNRHKGYAFAEYETEEIAQYAVKLFSGLVSIHKKTLRFSMSGQNKVASQDPNPNPNMPSLRRSPPSKRKHLEVSNSSPQLFTPCRSDAYLHSNASSYSQACSPVPMSNGPRMETSSYYGNHRQPQSAYQRFGTPNQPRHVPQLYDSRYPITNSF
ncbi:RNA-binding protein 7 [Amborella trichopoda]|uniref:RNA-binding protein 7 n=1 Tax=Amborella trichopoda TaxID=13333 RepID=UPI0005D2F801|nr:RNA-binding protein 7 [Amborella trichopoda]|eukprot:XP_011620993.1 RNA-binding protein 7 [Amborella trichopoda]